MRSRLVYTFLSSLFASFARCFRLRFVKESHYGIERSLFSYRVGSCEGVQSRGQQFIAAVIEDYFESRIAPVEVISDGPGAGEDHITLSLHWLAQRQRERTFQIGETDIV